MIAKQIARYCLNTNDLSDDHWVEQIGASDDESKINCFAFSLLVPSIALKAMIDIKAIKQSKQLRIAFGVPSYVLRQRLQEMGYIS